MVQKHPHADATYRVVRLDKTAFGVEVSIPETCPTTVSAFPSKAEAEAWILRHKEVVASSNSISRGPRSRSQPRPSAPEPAAAPAAAPSPPE